MKLFSFPPFLLLLISFGIHSCSPPEGNEQLHVDHTVNHVIVIGVDGLSPDGIRNAPTPVMDELMQKGAYTMHARSVLPTSSSSNWATMIMGAGPEQHGVTSNDRERDDHTLPPATLGSEDIFPSIFTLIRKKMPEAEVGAIYQWEGFGRLYEKSQVNYNHSPENELETAKDASSYLKEKKPNFLFVHLDLADGAGHANGHGSPEYYKAIARADSLIGVILEAARDAGMRKDMLMIISSDHGGIGNGHGGESLAEVEIPFIMYGSTVKPGIEIADEVYQYDNAATVAFALGIDRPHAWIGKPVKSAFKGFPDVTREGQGKMLPAPKIFPGRKGDALPGGLFMDEEVKVAMETDEPGATIYYTLDGSEPDRQSSKYTGPFQLSESAVVKARVFNARNEKSHSETAYFRLGSSDRRNGIKYSYYEGENWNRLPVFESLKPSRTGTTFEFRINDINQRDDQFGIVYEGFIKIDQEGEYKFYTISDDGSKLFINDTQVVDNDGSHGNIERSGEIELTPGLYTIKVLYFNEFEGKWLDVYYRGPEIPKQIIPPDVLFLEKES